MSKENLCIKCKKSVGNPVFTVCDDCWELDDNIIRAIESFKKKLIKKLKGLQNKKVKAQSYGEAAGVYDSIQLINQTP